MAEHTERPAPAPAPEASLPERFFLGLHAALPAALLAITLVQLLLPPPHGSAPAQQPAWLAWGAIGLWLPPALLAAVALRRRMPMWRAALSATAVLLLGCGAAGLALHTAHAWPFALAFALLATACAALAAAIGPHRLREHRRAPGRAPACHAPPPLWRRLLAGLPFWTAAVLMLEAFRLAHIVAREPQRGAGMVGMLLAFFLLLPAAALAPWLPRTAAALAGGAAAGFAWLALHSALAPWWLGVALSVAVAVQVLRSTPVRAGGGPR